MTLCLTQTVEDGSTTDCNPDNTTSTDPNRVHIISITRSEVAEVDIAATPPGTETSTNPNPISTLAVTRSKVVAFELGTIPTATTTTSTDRSVDPHSYQFGGCGSSDRMHQI